MSEWRGLDEILKSGDSRMKKCLIVIWFGKFPNYFDLFLKSCSWNPSWNWIIFTDQRIEEKVIPSNVRFISTDFGKMISQIENRLNVKLSTKIKPYKLCDLKPLYGYIFEKELEEEKVDYWGHCDIDVVWGNLSKFFPDDLIAQYDKFLWLGHLTLYKNTEQNNRIFKEAKFKNVDYKTIIRSRYNWGFDEYRKYALLRILEKKNGYRIYTDETNVADISPWEGYKIIDGLEPGKETQLKELDYVRVELGSVWVKYKSELDEKEKAYAHFQKREFDYFPIDSSKPYYFLCNTICQDKSYKGKQIVKKDNRYFPIRITQFFKIFEIIKFNIRNS